MKYSYYNKIIFFSLFFVSIIWILSFCSSCHSIESFINDISPWKPTYFYGHNPDTYSSEFVDPDTSLYFFDKTEYHISCCPQSYNINHSYSGTKSQFKTSGCACNTKKQLKYIMNRGQKGH